MARTMLSLPDTFMDDDVAAEQPAKRLRNGTAGYFRSFDALVGPVLPIPALTHGIEELVVNTRTAGLTYPGVRPCPLNVTGLPSCRCGSGRAAMVCQPRADRGQPVGRDQDPAGRPEAGAITHLNPAEQPRDDRRLRESSCCPDPFRPDLQEGQWAAAYDRHGGKRAGRPALNASMENRSGAS